MKNLKILFFICYFIGMLIFCLGISTLIVFSFKKYTFEINNINLDIALSTEDLKNIYASINSKDLEPIMFDTMKEAVENAKYYDTSFVGKLTHYGPDCALCGGYLGCNGQYARNGNIYYNDKEYGTVRIVASSKILPCGSIIRINVDAYDPNGMYAIVLDRGVSPGIIDLLKTSQQAISPVRTVNNVVFDIVRYGY